MQLSLKAQITSLLISILKSTTVQSVQFSIPLFQSIFHHQFTNQTFNVQLPSPHPSFHSLSNYLLIYLFLRHSLSLQFSLSWNSMQRGWAQTHRHLPASDSPVLRLSVPPLCFLVFGWFFSFIQFLKIRIPCSQFSTILLSSVFYYSESLNLFCLSNV